MVFMNNLKLYEVLSLFPFLHRIYPLSTYRDYIKDKWISKIMQHNPRTPRTKVNIFFKKTTFLLE